MNLISRTELKEKLDRCKDLKLVFALGEWQYRTMHIPGSLNLPCTPNLFSSADMLKGLEPEDEIVVYCSTDMCYASYSVYHLLMKRGYKNVSRYAGGLSDWNEAGYPLAGRAVAARSGSPAISPV